MNKYTSREELAADVDRQRELGVSAPGMESLIRAVAGVRDSILAAAGELRALRKLEAARNGQLVKTRQEMTGRLDRYLEVAADLVGGDGSLQGAGILTETRDAWREEEGDPGSSEPFPPAPLSDGEEPEAESEMERARRMPPAPGGRVLRPLQGGPHERHAALQRAVDLRHARDGFRSASELIPEGDRDQYLALLAPLAAQLDQWIEALEERAGVGIEGAR